MDGRVLIEQRQEHDHAFDNGRLHLRIKPIPGVVEPAVNRLVAVPAVCADRGRARAQVKRNVVAGQVRFELRVVGVSHVRVAERHP